MFHNSENLKTRHFHTHLLLEIKVKSVMPIGITDFFSYFWHFHIDILFMKEKMNLLHKKFLTGLSQAQKGWFL